MNSCIEVIVGGEPVRLARHLSEVPAWDTEDRLKLGRVAPPAGIVKALVGSAHVPTPNAEERT